MAGLRIEKINPGTPPTLGGLSKRAYRLFGKWAFQGYDVQAGTGSTQWKAIVEATPNNLLNVIASALNGVTGDKYLILYDSNIPQLDDASVSAYHSGHAVIIEEDGDNYTKFLLKGDKYNLGLGSYLDEYSLDNGESEAGPKKRRRAQRMFAMMLMTKCR